MIDNHIIRASFGTTKYCSYFLKGIECTNKECLFLHKLAGENDIIKRGELTVNKNIFNEQHKYAIKIADIFNPEVKKKILSMKKRKTVFPSPDIIYKTITVIEKEKTGKAASELLPESPPVETKAPADSLQGLFSVCHGAVRAFSPARSSVGPALIRVNPDRSRRNPPTQRGFPLRRVLPSMRVPQAFSGCRWCCPIPSWA